MGGEATTLTHDGFEYSGPAGDLQAEIGALEQPSVAAKGEAPPPASDVPRGTPPVEAPVKAEAKPSAQDTHDRIQRLTWEREEAVRRADAAEKRAADAAKPKPEPAARPTTKTEIARYLAMPGAPRIDDKDDAGADVYGDFSEFSAAQSLFIADKRYEERQAADALRAEAGRREQSSRERHEGFSKRLDAEKATDPELDAVLSASDAEIDQGPMAYVISTSDIGPKVMKYLALHPAEAARIAAIPHDMERYAQMRVLESTVRLTVKSAAAPPGSAPKDEAVKAATKAEPPINPVGSSPVSVKDDDAPPDDDADDAAWFKWRASHNIDGSRKVARR